MFKTLSECLAMVKAGCGVVARDSALVLLPVLSSLAGVVILASFIALSGIALAVAAEAKPFTGDCTDSVLLGSERSPELKRTMRAVRARKKAGEIVAAVDPLATIERGEIVFLLDTMGEGWTHADGFGDVGGCG